MFKDKILLITGGTGSFGNAVMKRFLDSDFKEVRIFSRDEKKQDDMRKKYNHPKLKFYLGDVRDYDSISQAMKNVNYVFHAAALKQVPSCEFYPMQANKTNVDGTSNAIEAAIANNVENFILLSTDKAVYPINAMGISKSMAEKVLVARSRQLGENETTLCVTRYGNVMASRGSVIPLFIEQIKNEQPLTVTDPNMTRFLMSLDEAVDLVLYAFQHGEQGDTFVQKAPASTVHDLAHGLVEMFESNVDVKVIGTRHGEKLYESLMTREEMVKAEDQGGYYRIPADNRDLNYSKFVEAGEEALTQVDEEYNSHNTERLDVPGVQAKVLELAYVRAELADYLAGTKGNNDDKLL